MLPDWIENKPTCRRLIIPKSETAVELIPLYRQDNLVSSCDFRLALRRNETVLIFNKQLENNKGPMFPIHLHPLFEDISADNMQFSLAMEHAYHNNEML